MKETKMRVLFDSNTVIDVLTNRAGSEDSIEVFMRLASGDIKGFLAAKQISDIYYVLRKYLDKKRRKEAIMKLLFIFDLAATDKDIILKAIDFDGDDFEDDIISVTSIRENIDYILTKDAKHFKKLSKKAISPKELIALIKNNI